VAWMVLLATTPWPTSASAIGFGHFAPAAMSAMARRMPSAASEPIKSGQPQPRTLLTGWTPSGGAARCEPDEDRQVIGRNAGERDQSQQEEHVRARDARQGS